MDQIRHLDPEKKMHFDHGENNGVNQKYYIHIVIKTAGM
jgi:hypothetical protein